MSMSKQYKGALVRVAAAMIVVAFGAAVVAAGYNDDQESQQSRQQRQYQDRQQRSMQSQDQDSWQQGQGSSMVQERNQQLERQIANELRQEGFGEEGQIMILALGNRVILLGVVPDQQQKQQAQQVTRQVSGVQRVDNRLQARSGTGRQNDSQLRQRIQQQLQNQTDAGRNIQVQVRNGRTTLSGQVDNWQEMADVLEAAFAAGAQNIASQLSTTGQSQFGAGQTDRGYQSRAGQGQYGDRYGYDQGTAPLGDRYGRSYDYDRFDSRSGQTYGQDQDRQQTDQSGRYDRPMGRTDQQFGRTMLMQQRLESRLRSQIPGGESISVLVAQDKAYLFGRVQNENAKQQAERILQQAAGIDDVENKIIVSEEGWERQNDAAIRNDIQSEMTWSPFVDAESIRVSVNNGVATLSGQVDDVDAAASVIENAFEGGARAIRNQLQIRGQMMAQERQFDTDRGYYPPYGYTPGRQERDDEFDWQQDRDQWQDRQQWDQQRGTRSQPQWQQQISASDMAMAHRVALQLQQQLQTDKMIQVMNPQAVYIHVSQGTATLHGFVQDNNQKQQAEQIARSIRGVQNVRNELKVMGQTGADQTFGYVPGQQQGARADSTLAHQIALQLQQRLGSQIIHVMDPDAIYVMVSEGTVMLHGSVQDNNQKQQAEQILQNVQGVRDVQNELQVQGQPQRQFGRQQQIGQQRQTGRQQQMTASDRRLTQQVEQQLERQLPDANIMASVRQGTVTLQGSVRDQNQKQQAERVVRSVQGVQNVRNSITVGGQGAEYPPLGYVPGQEGQMEQRQMQQDTGISGDQQCIQMLKQRLTDQNLQSMAQDAYVTCHRGTMALYGYVKTGQEKDQIEKMTRQIPDVNEVDNNLIVREGGWKQKPDSELKGDVESQLWWSPYVDSDKIEVTVQNGTVILSGQADDWDAMRAAVKNAFDAGARRVRSQIQYTQSNQTGQTSGEESKTDRQSTTGSRSRTSGSRNSQSGSY